MSPNCKARLPSEGARARGLLLPSVRATKLFRLRHSYLAVHQGQRRKHEANITRCSTCGESPSLRATAFTGKRGPYSSAIGPIKEHPELSDRLQLSVVPVGSHQAV